MSHVQEKQLRFMELLGPHQRSLERYVLAMTRDVESAKDVVGETLLVAFERFETLRSHAAFLSFLMTIATRTYRRRAAAVGRVDRMEEHAIERLLDPGISPEVAADIGAVHRALAMLPEKQREAVVLFEILGFSTREVQEIQGGTLVGVRVRITRGRQKLARILGVERTAAPDARGNAAGAELEDQAMDELHFCALGKTP